MKAEHVFFGVCLASALLRTLALGDAGDVRTVLSPQPSASQNLCATGLAFDGSSLYVNRCSDPNIYRISRVNGGLLSTFNPNNPEPPAAMAFDSKRNGLWISTQWGIGGVGFRDCGNVGMPIYFWDFADGSVDLMFSVPVSLANPATGQLFLRSCFLNGLT